MVMAGLPTSSISSARLPSSKLEPVAIGRLKRVSTPRLVTAARPWRILTAFPKQLLPTIRKSGMAIMELPQSTMTYSYYPN